MVGGASILKWLENFLDCHLNRDLNKVWQTAGPLSDIIAEHVRGRAL